MPSIKINSEKKWSFENCKAVLSFCLLKQIVRDFQESAEDILDEDEDSDQEIGFLMEVLKSLLPESSQFLDQKFDRDELVSTATLSSIFEIAAQFLNDPVKSLEFSIHNSLNYFLEDCGEMPGLEPAEIKVKAMKFFFPELDIPDNLEAFFHKLSSDYKSQDIKELETVYLHRVSKFLDDILELRYITD